MTHRDQIRSLAILAALLASLLWLSPSSPAQDQAPHNALADAPMEWDLPTIKNAVVDRVVRTAVIRYRSTPNQSDLDHRLIALVFEYASRHYENDVYMWRRAAEAWRVAGETRRELSALRRVLDLDPRDTVTQLRLLNASIENLDTAEERVARYDRMLTGAGVRLDASIRSRLALDASLLHRELGDEQRFLELLTLSTQLDMTNLDAASLVASVTLEKTRDPLSRIELLANVVLADPLRYESHMALANEFQRHGAFNAAYRFFEIARALATSHGVTLDEHAMLRTFLARWGTRGASTLLHDLQEDEARFLYAIEQQRRAVEDGHMDPSEVMAFEPVEASSLLQLYLGLTLENDEVVSESLDRLVTISEENIAGFRTLEETGQASPDEIELGEFSSKSDLIWHTLLANKRIDEAATWLDDLRVPDVDAARQNLARLRAMLAYRTGDSQGAQAMLEPLTHSDPLAHLGLAIIYRDEQRPLDAARSLARVIQKLEGEAVALWARAQIEALLDQPLRPTSVASSLESYARAMPTTIDEFALEPSRWQDLQAEAPMPRLTPTDRISLRVTLTNTSNFPLAVGEGRPLETRLLCAPRLSLGGQLAHQLARPEMVQIGSRLRLESGESITQDVWLGTGQLGESVMRPLHFPANIRWRVVQGFTQDPSGRYATGPHSISNSSPNITRPVVFLANNDIEALIGLFETKDPDVLLSAVLVSGNSFIRANNVQDLNEQFRLRTMLSSELVRLMPRLPEPLVGLLAHSMPTANNFEAELRELDDTIAQSTDTLIQLVYLLTRVTRSDDPFLPHMSTTSTDPIALEIADVFARSLRQSEGRTTSDPD
ncbi:MAG: hypothetical protein ACYTF7_01540 [Planctomycetota bacterium]|jgi:tetratricopeptide (TPR) repeat protein